MDSIRQEASFDKRKLLPYSWLTYLSMRRVAIWERFAFSRCRLAYAAFLYPGAPRRCLRTPAREREPDGKRGDAEGKGEAADRIVVGVGHVTR